MPVISMFYGVIVMMYFFDDKQHQEELMANWKLAINGQKVFRIEPLK